MSLTFNEASHRYKLDGKPASGATTILSGGIPKPMLVWWAGGIVSKWALDPQNREKLTELQARYRNTDTTACNECGLETCFDCRTRKECVTFLQKLPNKERDDAGERGTAVHKMGEALVQTGTVDIPAEFEFLASFVEGYADFLDEWMITPVLVERPVANREHWYVGTFDLLAQSPLLMSPEDIAAGKCVQIDLKTPKGVYGEVALQTAAYARAETYLGEDGMEHPLPEVIKNYVAHVTPLERETDLGKRYRGKPLGTSLYQLAGNPAEIDEHFQMFLHAKAVHEDAKARNKIIGEPMIPPVPAVKAAA